jgi:hypothetical protein
MARIMPFQAPTHLVDRDGQIAEFVLAVNLQVMPGQITGCNGFRVDKHCLSGVSDASAHGDRDEEADSESHQTRSCVHQIERPIRLL